MVSFILLVQGEDDNNTCNKQTNKNSGNFQEKCTFTISGTNLVILLAQAVGEGGQLRPEDQSLLRDTEPSRGRSENVSKMGPGGSPGYADPRAALENFAKTNTDGQLPHSRMDTVFSLGSEKETGPMRARLVGGRTRGKLYFGAAGH